MHQHLVVILIVFCVINQIFSGDVTYLDLSELETSNDRYFRNNYDNHPSHSRYIDVYTNYPHVETVLENYKSVSNRYNHRVSRYMPVTIYNNRRKIETPGGDEFTFSDDNFVYMQSEKYIDPQTDNWPKSTPYSFHYPLTERPQFKTRKNKTSTKHHHSFTNIQKIPKPIQKNPPKPTKSTTTNINEILKKYIAKLQSKKQPRPKKHVQAIVPQIKPKNVTKVGKVHSKFFEEPLMALKNKTMKFAHKFLSLFTIIQFPNSRCQANGVNTGDYEGTCYHVTECDSLNGTAIGECAEGYGVCCVFRYTCGDSTNQNCSYFESPGYPDYRPPNGGVLPPTTAPPGPPPTVPTTTTMLPTEFPETTTTESTTTTDFPSTTTSIVTAEPTEEPTTTTMNPTPDPRKDLLFHHFHRRVARQAAESTDLSCIFMVYKASNDIQQMRIDFIDLELRGPTNGECIEERLVITGQNINDRIPAICGYNTGQHVYVDVSNLNGPLQISVLSTLASRKRYKIRICQLATSCSTSTNCLQYYTGVRGVISSFNYDQAAMYSRSMPGYFNNLNYAICIKKEPGYCSITYSNVQNGVEYPFELINVDDDGISMVPAGQAGADVLNCPDDYIIVNGLRLCGYKLNDGSMISDFTMNAPVTDNGAGPIIIPVRTDRRITGRGFKLFYTQNLCTTY